MFILSTLHCRSLDSFLLGMKTVTLKNNFRVPDYPDNTGVSVASEVGADIF